MEMDSELSMKKHVSKVIGVFYFATFICDVWNPFDAFSIKRQSPVWSQLSSSVNSITVTPYWLGCQVHPSCHYIHRTGTKYRAKLICAIGPRDHVTPSLRDLHWLPLEQRIIFKLCFQYTLWILITVLNIFENLSRWHIWDCISFPTAFCNQSTPWDAMQRLVWSSVNGASRLQGRLHGILKTELFDRAYTII